MSSSNSLILLLLGCVFGHHQLDIAENYQSHMRPLAQDEKKPLEMVAALNLRNIVDISETRQQITLETSLKLYWKDKNIKIKKDVTEFDGTDKNHDYILLDPKFMKDIWMPDIFIDQSINIRVPNFYTTPASIRVYNNSLIRLSSRFNFDVACPMNFSKYPVDDQTCLVMFESFSYKASQLNMTWDPNKKAHNIPKVELAQFKYHIHREPYTTKEYTEPFAGLLLRIHLVRQIDFHIIQTYLPSTILVILGYLVLFLPAKTVPGRIGLGMMTYLTLTTMNSSNKSMLPQVSYMTFMDIWVITCILFVFTTNVVSIIEIVMLKSGMVLVGKKFNLICKILLPALFIVFNTVYWPIILIQYWENKTITAVHRDDH
eukprot:GFUD01020095.1.p1 GENE.GFUD01020095.1~~GFUD01020095.1.p1  ORF type:complete len:373 (-),score=101.77 GFUD01020095.1:109-1227(-)